MLTFIFLLSFVFIFNSYTCASNVENKGKSYNLQECIERALKFSPEIAEATYEEEVYRAKKIQADSAELPKIEILSLVGPSPEAKKEDFLRTDVATRVNGIFGGVEVTLIQPIYTYGKIRGYKEAAEGGLKVAKAGVLKKKSEIILRTKELYFNFLFAKDIKNLILEIKEQLSKSIEKTEKQLQIGSPWADEVNIYKFRAYLGEVEKNLNEVDKNILFLKEALKASMGLPKDIEFDIAENTLLPEERIPDSLEEYIQSAHTNRPELIQLKAGLEATKALIDVERSNFYPQFFVGMKTSILGATNRDKIKNPYISDDLNRSYGAIFAGFKMPIDFGLTKGRVMEAEAEHGKIKEKQRFAYEVIPLHIKKAYFDFEESKKNINELHIAFTNAKKWLVSATANYDMGVGEAKDVADAASAYALTKTNYLKSILNHRISYATLLNASGLDISGKY
ncbi:MAG: TolC family protein [Thermodesulfovibrionales bacterium]|nr:TolC family protein [Thermodesulfovibrionales bacterium]